LTHRKIVEDMHMPLATESVAVSKKVLWASYIVSALPVLLLLFSGVMKVMRPPTLVQGFVQYGFPESLIIPIGIIELACTVVYLIPQTAVLGAILVTGYLGGAVVTNLRIGNNQWVMPVFVGVLAWTGLYMRDHRIRALIPLRK
jgi:hypothetical protein